MAATVDAKIRTLIAVLRDNPRDVETRLKLAKLYAKASRTELAITEYLHLSNVYAAQGNILTSISYLNRVLELQPAHAFAHRSMLHRCHESGRLAQGRAHVEGYLRAHVRPLAASGETGEALARLRALGDLRDCGAEICLPVLRSIAELDPHDTGAARELASLLAAAEPKEAIVFAHRCLRANPEDLAALESLALAFTRLGERAKARAAWEQVISAAERASDERRLRAAREALTGLS